jgi:hypothetical protein
MSREVFIDQEGQAIRLGRHDYWKQKASSHHDLTDHILLHLLPMTLV